MFFCPSLHTQYSYIEYIVYCTALFCCPSLPTQYSYIEFMVYCTAKIFCPSLRTLFIYTLCRVSQEECARLREGVPYAKLYRYNQKHLSPKRNGYGDNGQRKVWSSCGSTHCTCRPTPALNVDSHDTLISWRLGSELHSIKKARCITQ